MGLDDFVAATLTQIVSGVAAAKEEVAAQGGKINPEVSSSHGSRGQWDLETGTPVQEIEFDVAVTASEASKGKAGAGLVFGPVVLGSVGETGAANQQVSRIRFTVPLLLPTTQPAS